MIIFMVETKDDPDDADAMSAFVRFVGQEVIPTIGTTPTRTGQVTEIRLYSSGNRGLLNRYVLTVEGLVGPTKDLADALDGLRQAGATVEQVGQSFGATKWVPGPDGQLEEVTVE